MATWTWPVPGSSTITSGVGPRWGSQHNGIDISAPKGTPVVAASAGTVKVANGSACAHNYGKSDVTGPNKDNCAGGYGNHIYIDHGNGFVTRYAHLTSVSVKVGQSIDIGQQIGTVGSTGNSSGFHLHFEIRLDGKVQDPEKFVSPSGKTITPSAISSNVTSTTGSNSSVIEASPLAIIGQRVSDSSLQPMRAYVNIYIGQRPLIPYNTIQNFSITRYLGVGDKAEFQIFDDTWSTIETQFSDNWKNIKIEYGYLESGKKSNLYNMMLQNYSIAFTFTGVTLTVGAMSQGQYSNLTQRTIETGSYNPTEAIKIIARGSGYIVEDSNFEDTEDVSRANPYTLTSDFPITYIMDTILPEAISKSTGEAMYFYIDSDNKAYLKSYTYFAEGTTSTDNIRTYIYQKGYDSPIIDLTFDIKGVFGGTTEYGLASGGKRSVFDPLTKEELSYSETTKSVTMISPGNTQHTYSDQSLPNGDSSAYSPTQTYNRLWYDISRAVTDMYEATMVIIGDPTISLFERIRIINITDDGFMHHTSGIYMIKGIVDTVSDGYMTTTLKLQRNGDINEGVELLNTKVRVK